MYRTLRKIICRNFFLIRNRIEIKRHSKLYTRNERFIVGNVLYEREKKRAGRTKALNLISPTTFKMRSRESRPSVVFNCVSFRLGNLKETKEIDAEGEGKNTALDGIKL